MSASSNDEAWGDWHVMDGDLGTAAYSDDMLHRYWLRIPLTIGGGGVISFVGLNPSTATHDTPDPTVKRCMKRAKGMGYSTMYMLNLFSYRATDPKAMKAHKWPTTAWTDQLMLSPLSGSKMVVLCWGNHGAHQRRSDQFLARHRSKLMGKSFSFKITKQGQPGHPLYLPSNQPLTRHPI